MASVTTRAPAISALLMPWASRRRTCVSRSLSWSKAGGTLGAPRAGRARRMRSRVTTGSSSASPAGDDADGVHQLLGGGVLEQEAARPGPQRLGDVVLAAEGGEDQDLAVAQLAGGGDAVHAGHLDVHHDHVGVEALGLFHGRRCRCRPRRRPVMSGWAPRIMANPWRISGWSSAMRTRMSFTRAPGVGGWRAERIRRPVRARRTPRRRTVRARRRMPGRPWPPGAETGGRRAAGRSLVTRRSSAVAGAGHLDAGGDVPGVLDHVGEGFLDDPVGGRSRRCAAVARERRGARRREVRPPGAGRTAPAARPVPAWAPSSPWSSVARPARCSRPGAGRRPGGASRSWPRARRRSWRSGPAGRDDRREGRLDRPGLHDQQADVVPDRVVQFPGDPDPFVENRLGGQQLAVRRRPARPAGGARRRTSPIAAATVQHRHRRQHGSGIVPQRGQRRRTRRRRPPSRRR